MRKFSLCGLTTLVLLLGIGNTTIYGQLSGGDFLNEAPLLPIPSTMTFQEYQDMNRRLSVGLVLSAIPVPGMIHFYAGERKTGKRILGTAVLGAVSIVAGAATAKNGDFPTSDYDVLILNRGNKERERRFEKIPITVTNTDTTFKLRELSRDPTGVGSALILLGAAVIVSDIVYDFVHGIRTIETKRDRVRFKYGKSLTFGLNSRFDSQRLSPSFELSYSW
ncbi:MAG: hypothetical protein ACE5DP_03300 [Fidelibacterota bacterium]